MGKNVGLSRAEITGLCGRSCSQSGVWGPPTVSERIVNTPLSAAPQNLSLFWWVFRKLLDVCVVYERQKATVTSCDDPVCCFVFWWVLVRSRGDKLSSHLSADRSLTVYHMWRKQISHMIWLFLSCLINNKCSVLSSGLLGELAEFIDPTGAGESVRNGPVLLGLVMTPAEKPQL